MDRQAKLAAARKKLNQFKKKKGKRNDLLESTKSDTSSNSELDDAAMHVKAISDIKQSEKFIDEKFEMLHCMEGDENDPLSSTAATTESILQVSAKLNGIAADADVFIDYDKEKKEIGVSQDLPASNSVHEPVEANHTQGIETHSTIDSTSQVHSVDDGQYSDTQYQQRTNQHQDGDAMLEDGQDTDPQAAENEALKSQLQWQMQTIGLLVSEKRDLQQEISVLKNELRAAETERTKVTHETHTVKDRLISVEKENRAKSESLGRNEQLLSEIQCDYESCKQMLEQTKYRLDNEQAQVAELSAKLQQRDAEYHELYSSHADLQEKLGMADVLLQQMSSHNEGDAESKFAVLLQEKEALSVRLDEYSQAFEQLTAEREQLSKQYTDAQSRWQIEFQNLHSQIQTMESDRAYLMKELSTFQEASQEDTEQKPDVEAETNDSGTVKESIELLQLQQQLTEAYETRNLMQEELASLQGNNQYLSNLAQEKESRIYELENELEQVKGYMSKHEELLDGARSDKVTISRALLQNKQLKEQLEEIQQGFIRMSNDKMDLATQLSSLEHANRDLQECLNQNSSFYLQTKQELEAEKRKNIQLQHELSQQKSLTNNSDHQYTNSDEADILKIMQLKLADAEQSITNLNAENNQLRNSVNHLQSLRPVEVVEHPAPVISEQSTVADEPYIEKEGETLPRQIEDNPVEVMTEDELIQEQPAEDPRHEQLLRAMAQLQGKFTAVMREKVELLEKLDLLEHTNTQLQSECDTIGEYIALYHNQRQTLKQRHREKDEYISKIIQEREVMQGKVEQLQTLIVVMLNNRQSSENESPDVSIADIDGEGSQRQDVPLDQPDLVPRSKIPATEEAKVFDSPTVPGRSRKVRTSQESSVSEGDSPAAAQILTLLEQIQKPIDPAILNKNTVPSGFCMRYIGPYTAI